MRLTESSGCHETTRFHLAASKANTTIEDIPVRTVYYGRGEIERKETGKSHRFVCLIGEKGKVLLTFFTAQ